MKKLVLYFLSSLLVLGIFSCKHRDKQDSLVGNPNSAESQTPVISKEDLAQKTENIPATEEVQHQAKQAAATSSDEVVQETFNNSYADSLRDYMTETKHPNYLRVKVKDGTYRIFNKRTGEYSSQVYQLIDDFVKEGDTYVTRVQVAKVDGIQGNQHDPERGHYKVIDGNLETVVGHTDYSFISSFQVEDLRYAEKRVKNNQEIITISNTDRASQLRAKVQEYDSVIHAIDIHGKTLPFYYVDIPKLKNNYLVLQKQDEKCVVISYRLQDLETNKLYESERTASNIPLKSTITKLQVEGDNIHFSTEPNDPLPSCEEISGYLNEIEKTITVVAVTYTIDKKEPIKIYY